MGDAPGGSEPDIMSLALENKGLHHGDVHKVAATGPTMQAQWRYNQWWWYNATSNDIDFTPQVVTWAADSLKGPSESEAQTSSATAVDTGRDSSPSAEVR